jgi:hypothetical protein
MVILAVTPVLVVFSLLAVALLMTPALVALVAQRRFPISNRKKVAHSGARVVTGLQLFGGSCTGSVCAIVAGAAFGAGTAAVDLGLADLPCDGV